MPLPLTSPARTVWCDGHDAPAVREVSWVEFPRTADERGRSTPACSSDACLARVLADVTTADGPGPEVVPYDLPAPARTFYLGAPEPAWLRRTATPLFVSHNRLRRLKTHRRATCRWALDSGGFSELGAHGRWTIGADEYARAVRRYSDEIGGLDWAAPQDWMCEEDQLRATGLTVEEHQRRTVDNYLELRAIAPDLPIAPVIQGWVPGQYLRCAEAYLAAGVDLAALPVVGVGSICRSQSSLRVWLVIQGLNAMGLRNLHGFGVKTDGLDVFGDLLATADSQGWSAGARHRQEPCEEGQKDCRNCLHYAEAWGDDVRARWANPRRSVLT